MLDEMMMMMMMTAAGMVVIMGTSQIIIFNLGAYITMNKAKSI
jgi:hypothetical protein